MKTSPPALLPVAIPALALVGILLAATTGLHADTYTDPTSGLVLEYSVADGEATVTGITDESLPADGKLVIPETLGGAPVTAIGENAFAGTDQAPNTGLLELDAPSVERIGDEAFYKCVSLASVSLPAVNSIGEIAFHSCTSLTDLSLPAATSIKKSAFDTCWALATVSMPVATSIGDGAFFDCIALATAHLPEVTLIEAHAFNGCNSLTAISLPKVTSVQNHTFFSCDKLASIDLPAATSIAKYAFFACRKLTRISLPAAASIGEHAFHGCKQLTTVSLPEATSIGKEAFAYNNLLKQVYLGRAAALDDANVFVNSHGGLKIHHHPEHDTHFTSGNWASVQAGRNEVIRPYLKPIDIIVQTDTVEVLIYRKLKGAFEDPEDWTYTVEQSTDLQVWATVTPTLNSRSISGDTRIDFRHISRDAAAAFSFYRVRATPNFFSTD